MMELQQKIEKETAAEAMIKSKGFKEAYVRMDDTTVDVVVDKDKLTDAEVAQLVGCGLHGLIPSSAIVEVVFYPQLFACHLGAIVGR